MLDLKLIRDNPDQVKVGIAAKGYSPDLVDQITDLDRRRRELMVQIEQLRAQRNQLSASDIETGKHLKASLKQLEPELEQLSHQLDQVLPTLPNLPFPEVPVGKNDSENVVTKSWGQPRHFDFSPQSHLELGANLGILDFASGAKVTGSQFYYLIGDGALLELSLTRFCLDFLSQAGFTPVITPDLAKSRYYLGTGYAPKGDEAQTYTISDTDLGLIATAEVTLAGRHADEVIGEDQLPLKYVGYSHCFRQEAGAYGKYSKGLYRVHQFTKAEMFVYCLPEDSASFHQQLLTHEEHLCQALGLPYRVVEMCTGDLGAMAARKYDIEVWLPGRADYGELTSTSNCTDYQARNLNIRFKRRNGETGFVHMLNGTALPISSRAIVAILENYQNADGSVTVPDVLRPYLGKDVIR